jgi:hypothetical protein
MADRWAADTNGPDNGLGRLMFPAFAGIILSKSEGWKNVRLLSTSSSAALDYSVT